MKQGKRILIVGYGKLGHRVAATLSGRHEVFALKRSHCISPKNLDILFADVTHPNSLTQVFDKNLEGGVDYLIYCLSPSERSEKGYEDAYLTGLKNVLLGLPNRSRLQHILFISSTSVYHQAKGENVDELSPCQPSNFSGKVLLEAESFLGSLDTPSTCIRFSGIYGGDRSRLIDQVQHALTKNEGIEAAPGYTNRIHEDDCVGFICYLISLLDQGETIESCYVATDSCPVEQADVYAYIAERLSAIHSEHANQALNILVTNQAKSMRRAGSKRCINKRMEASGYQLKFASYKEGYNEQLRSINPCTGENI